MPPWSKVAGSMFLAGVALAALCARNTPPDVTVRTQIPHGYHGPVLIVFDDPTGQKLRWVGDVLHLDVPRSGVLKIRESMDAYPESWRPTAFTDDGVRLPIPLSNSDPPFDPDCASRKDGLGLYGGTNHDNKVMAYFVGTFQEFRQPDRGENLERAAGRFLPKPLAKPVGKR